VLSEAEVRCAAVIAVPERSRRQEPKSAEPKYGMLSGAEVRYTAVAEPKSAEPKYAVLSGAEVWYAAVVAVPAVVERSRNQRSRRQEPKSMKPKYVVLSRSHKTNRCALLRWLWWLRCLRQSRGKQSVQSVFCAICFFCSQRERGFWKWPLSLMALEVFVYIGTSLA
jgi:hypothetical protein